MRRALSLLTAFLVLLASTQVLGAEKKTIKWLTSIYSDAKGVPLKHPEGVACSGEQFVIADTGNGRILRYSWQGDTVTMDSEFALPKSYPTRVHLNSKGDLYYLDGRERRIEAISAAGEEMGPVSHKGLPFSTEVIPKSFALDGSDNLYLLDNRSRSVLVLEPDGKFLRQVHFPEEYGFFTDLTVDRQGGILLLDGVEAVIYLAVRDADHFSRMTDSMKAYMNFPTSLSLDEWGVVYLVDQYGSGLGLVGQDGSFLGRKLGLGWKDGALYYPSQICVSRTGIMLIADRSNSRVQIFAVGEGGSAAGGEQAGAAN